SGDSPLLLPHPLLSGTSSDLLKTGTESTLLKTGTENTLLKTGTDSTLLRTGTESTTLKTGTGQTLIQAGVEEKAEQLNVLILMDSSHTMGEGLEGSVASGGDAKIDAARRVLADTLRSIPRDINVGLRVFGQSFRNDPYIDCQQSVLM